jgi:hypothetical protein
MRGRSWYGGVKNEEESRGELQTYIIWNQSNCSFLQFPSSIPKEKGRLNPSTNKGRGPSNFSTTTHTREICYRVTIQILRCWSIVTQFSAPGEARIARRIRDGRELWDSGCSCWPSSGSEFEATHQLLDIMQFIFYILSSSIDICSQVMVQYSRILFSLMVILYLWGGVITVCYFSNVTFPLLGPMDGRGSLGQSRYLFGAAEVPCMRDAV